MNEFIAYLVVGITTIKIIRGAGCKAPPREDTYYGSGNIQSEKVRRT